MRGRGRQEESGKGGKSGGRRTASARCRQELRHIRNGKLPGGAFAKIGAAGIGHPDHRANVPASARETRLTRRAIGKRPTTKNLRSGRGLRLRELFRFLAGNRREGGKVEIGRASCRERV